MWLGLPRMGNLDLLELLIHQPIFIGFKLDSTLRRILESLSDPDKKYVSAGESAFLRLCRVGEDVYVGKLIHERLSTDHVDDVRRNVLSIVRRLCQDVRLPSNLEIFACSAEEANSHTARPLE